MAWNTAIGYSTNKGPKYIIPQNSIGRSTNQGAQYYTPKPAAQNINITPTGGGNIGVGSNEPAYTGENEADLARRGYEAKVNAAKSSLQVIRDMIADQIKQATGVRDQVVENIASRFGNLRSEATSGLEKVKNFLSEEDRGVVRDYDNADMRAARAAQGAQNKNSLIARALGIDTSSQFGVNQGQIIRSLQDRLGLSDEERTAKRTGIKQRGTEAEAENVRIMNELGSEEVMLKSQADRELQQTISKAQVDERLFGIDSAETIENAVIGYQQNLNSISDYVRTRAAEMADRVSGSVNAFTPQIAAATDPTGGGLAAILAKTQGIDATADPYATIDGAETNTSGATSRPITTTPIKQKNPWDEFLYGIGVGGGGGGGGGRSW